jgi:hypothetical protein
LTTSTRSDVVEDSLKTVAVLSDHPAQMHEPLPGQLNLNGVALTVDLKDAIGNLQS